MQRRPFALLLLATSGGLALGVIFFTFDPARHPFPRCPFNLLTGLYCPGCGSQRATHALLHGRLAEAAGLNLLAILSLPLLALGALDGVRAAVTGRPRRAALLYQPWLPKVLAGLVVAFAVLRNLPGPLGAWLAP